MIKEYPINYLITHIGDGKFTATYEDGKILEVGPSLRGIIRYTYFENFTLPFVGWNVEHKKLMEDYFPKVTKDLADGKISKTSEINWII